MDFFVDIFPKVLTVASIFGLLILLMPPLCAFGSLYWGWWYARLSEKRLSIQERSYRAWKKAIALEEEMKGDE